MLDFPKKASLAFLNLLYLSFFFIFPFALFSQNKSTFVFSDTLHFHQDTLFLKKQNLVPFSEKVKINQIFITENQYKINYQKGYIVLKKRTLEDSICTITYRIFGTEIENELALRTLIIKKDTQQGIKYTTKEVLKGWDDFLASEEGKLRKSGSISRGITVGNNQSLALNSGMRLEVEGDLGDGLKIVGSLTDENIPIQPDGTTQQISDFDKIFIQLKKDAFSVTMGDYEVTKKGSRFADIYRNVTGMKVGYDKKNLHLSASGAMAKGKFFTNSFNGKDGVSGPYRLTGRTGEQFFTILAGSEKVYLNGKLLVRGETNDYVMDYNTAQLTFTSRIVMTNVSRLVVDFEYMERYYNRSLFYSNADYSLLKNKLSLKFSYGRDADNPNNPFDNPAAYQAAKQQLSEAGEVSSAYTSGVSLAPYVAAEVRYEKRDTLVNSVAYVYYKYSRDSLYGNYKIYFSFVGAGKGNYKRDVSGINQNVYYWVAPDVNFSKLGDYDTVRVWALPKLQQVGDLQMQYQLGKNAFFYTETALSQFDKNRLSVAKDATSVGLANVAGIKLENVKLRDSTFFSAEISHSFVQSYYNNLDRVYKAEYGRVWNFNDLTTRSDEQIASAKMQLNFKNKIKLQTENGFRFTGEGKWAFRQVYNISSSYSKYLQGNFTYTNLHAEEKNIARNGTWQRQEGDIFYRKKKWQPGIEIWIENKKERLKDTLSMGSFNFIDLKPYLRTKGDEHFIMDFSLNYRYDKEYFAQKYREKSRAFTHYYKIIYAPNNKFNLQNITSYRILNVIDTAFLRTELSANRTFNENLQLEYKTKMVGDSRARLFSINSVYDIAAQQIAKRDVRFIQVNNGQGEYEWIDNNNDQIQDFNEFILSNNPLSANFIRVLVPTQQLFPTTKPSLKANIQWDLRAVIAESKKPLMEVLRNFRSNTLIDVSQNKQRANTLSTYLISLKIPERDTNFIDAKFSLRQEWIFFQNHPTATFKISYQNTQFKNFYSTGNELRTVRYWNFYQRYTVDNNKSAEFELNFGKKATLSEPYPTRNYNIHYFDLNPRGKWQVNRKIGAEIGYQFKLKRNFNDSLIQNTQIVMHKLSLSGRIGFKDRNYLSPKIEWVQIVQKGEAPFAADYELKEGLKTGTNFIWNVDFAYFILKDIELSVGYNGRASEKNPIIHTGRMQVRAFF